MREERESPDEVIGALVARLQVLPESRPQARAAILSRVRGRRPSPWRAALASMIEPSVPLIAAATLTVAALGVGYAGRVLVEPTPAVSDGGAGPVPTAGLVPVSNDASSPRLVARQFVLDDPAAERVALVGDFNGWNPATAAMKNLTGAGVWEITVLLPPGRHTYAFLVNDSIWTLDPRAPQESDPDFGRASSVILVTER